MPDRARRTAVDERAAYDSPSVSLEGRDPRADLHRATAPPRDAEPGVGTDGVRFWNKADDEADT